MSPVVYWVANWAGGGSFCQAKTCHGFYLAFMSAIAGLGVRLDVRQGGGRDPSVALPKRGLEGMAAIADIRDARGGGRRLGILEMVIGPGDGVQLWLSSLVFLAAW